MKLSRDELNFTIHYLKRTQGLRPPYNTPFEFGDFSDAPVQWTEELWNSYQWNPPQYYEEFSDYDQEASPKPSWEDLVEACFKESIDRIQNHLLEYLDEVASKRIGKIYHPKANLQPEKEWQVRLSGKDISKENAERIRLVKRHNEIKQRIENTTNIKTFERIQNILDMDELWSAQDFPNTFPK